MSLLIWGAKHVDLPPLAPALTRDIFFEAGFQQRCFLRTGLKHLTTFRATFSGFCITDTFRAAEALKFKQCIM